MISPSHKKYISPTHIQNTWIDNHTNHNNTITTSFFNNHNNNNNHHNNTDNNKSIKKQQQSNNNSIDVSIDNNNNITSIIDKPSIDKAIEYRYLVCPYYHNTAHNTYALHDIVSYNICTNTDYGIGITL